MHTSVLLDRGVKPRDSRIVAVTEQDVEPILDHNKELRSMPQKSDWGRHIGTIPNVILVKWLNEEYQRGNVGLRMYTAEFNDLIGRKLQDPDWAYLRTDK